MKLNINILVLCMVCSCSISSLFAQSNKEHVTIVGSFQPKLGEFNKINVLPEIENTTFEIGDTSVMRTDTVLTSDIELELISPINLKTEETQDNFTNFVLAGLGTRISPVFIYMHNSKLSKNTSFGLGISHHSSWLNKQEYAPSSFMNSSFGISLDNKLNNYLLKTKVIYKNEMLRHYGFFPDDFPTVNVDVESITQKYQTVGLQSHLQGNTKTSIGFNHEIGVSYQYFHDKFQTDEHSFAVETKGEKSYKWLKNNAKQSISLEAGLQTWFNSDSLKTANNMQLVARPSLKLAGDFYQLKLGFAVVLHSHENSNIHLYPALEGGLFLLDKNLKFYSSLGGDAQRVSFQKLANENPFVSSIVPMHWQQTKIDFKGGVKALVMKNLDLNFGIGYRKTDDEFFFITDSTAPFSNKFLVVYDDVEVVSFVAEAAYRFNRRIDVKAVYHNTRYTTKTLTTAFYRPVNQIQLSGEYAYNETLHFTSSIYYVGERMASTYKSGTETLHSLTPYVDLNIGARYKVNESFNVFVQTNNLLNLHYDRFYHFPVNGVEFYGGITIRF
ncbi:MAG: TonB-dependent receptor [Bacteroidales bacterium]|nr:TonB-dependent receptor [Bacteroidales bacterium]